MGLGAPGLNVSFVTGFMEENETLAYQYEDARETKLWKKVIISCIPAGSRFIICFPLRSWRWRQSAVSLRALG